MTIAHDFQLPALLDGAYSLVRAPSHHLQDNEGEKNQADVADHRPIYPALARLQSRILLGVAKERLDGSTVHLALHHARKVGSRVVCDDVLAVAVTVSGHDQPQSTVGGCIDAHSRSAHPLGACAT